MLGILPSDLTLIGTMFILGLVIFAVSLGVSIGPVRADVDAHPNATRNARSLGAIIMIGALLTFAVSIAAGNFTDTKIAELQSNIDIATANEKIIRKNLEDATIREQQITQEFERQSVEMKAEISRLRLEITELEQSPTNGEALARAQERIEQLENELKQNNLRLNEHSRNNSNLAKNNESLVVENRRLDDDNESLRKQAAAAEQKIGELKAGVSKIIEDIRKSSSTSNATDVIGDKFKETYDIIFSNADDYVALFLYVNDELFFDETFVLTQVAFALTEDLEVFSDEFKPPRELKSKISSLLESFGRFDYVDVKTKTISGFTFPYAFKVSSRGKIFFQPTFEKYKRNPKQNDFLGRLSLISQRTPTSNRELPQLPELNQEGRQFE